MVFIFIRLLGCHTFSLTVKSSYTEIQNIRASKLCVLKGYDKYYLNAPMKSRNSKIPVLKSICTSRLSIPRGSV